MSFGIVLVALLSTLSSISISFLRYGLIKSDEEIAEQTKDKQAATAASTCDREQVAESVLRLFKGQLVTRHAPLRNKCRAVNADDSRACIIQSGPTRLKRTFVLGLISLERSAGDEGLGIYRS